MNKKIREIINDEKRKFCLQHDLFIEYMPYLINGKGDTFDGRSIVFKKVTSERYRYGDYITLRLNDEEVAIQIKELNYNFATNINYDNCETISDNIFPNQVRLCKVKTDEITDEEFKFLRQLYLHKQETKKENPRIYTKVPDIFYSIGILLGIVGTLGSMAIGAEYGASIGWSVFAIVCIQVSLFVGFGKIVELLCEIANRQK